MSTAVGVRFSGGRYHASPWKSHVNEAAVEWPPSPLRILRALIATWHRKADVKRHSEEALRGLINLLADDEPVYRLPTAVLAHSRHYMPVRSGRKERRTLVFDAFLRVDPDDELIVSWPETTLSDNEEDLLGHLLERMGYLGRAESWVECRLLDEWTDLPDSGPEAAAQNWRGDDDRLLQPVELPAAVPADVYVQWREHQIELLGLQEPRRVREKRLRATLPETLIDALRLDTGKVRDAGWSRMPGTRNIAYLRPERCLDPTPRVRRPRASPWPLTTVRLALLRSPRQSQEQSRAGTAPLPLLEDAVKVGEAMRAAAMSRARDVNPILSGHNLRYESPHQHAFYLPEDADADGRIDHVTVHAEAELDDSALQALDRIERLWLDEGAEWRVIIESYGSKDDFLEHAYVGPAPVWRSVTPYLHPWFRKKSFTVQDQIRRELAGRGFPEPELEQLQTIELRGRERRPVHFHRFRNRKGLTQPDTHGSFWRLTFPEPVSGPIALGFGCHFGLGTFAAMAISDR